jgi:hypothetical protein
MALAELYARGEIDADEYRRRQAVLREQHDQGPLTDQPATAPRQLCIPCTRMGPNRPLRRG